jgi:hypothetical protein
MIMKSMLFTGLAASFMLTACENDKSAGPTGGKTGLLTGAKWKISAHTITPGVDEDGDGVLTTNLFSSEGSCTQDDVTQYSANGKWSVDEGATKCDPSDPQVETGTWKLDAADSLTMISDLDDVTLKGKVESLTASQFRLSRLADWDDGVDHIETLTFSAQ